MKRDKAWLKEKLNTEKYYRETNELKTKTTFGELYDRGVSDGINAALEFINQLDEPEVTLDRAFEKVAESYHMTKEEIWRHLERLVAHGGKVTYGEPEVLSQEWIDEHTYHEEEYDFYYVDPDELKNLLVPKREKPVIPQFVADYIELNKGWSEDRQEYIEDDSSGLWFALNGTNHGMPNSVLDWLFNEEKVETFAKAWLDGYEVEKEQKYQVVIRDGECVRLYLCKNNGNVTIGTNDNYIEKCPEVTYLTEQEIKGYDKRFWAFAEEVADN